MKKIFTIVLLFAFSITYSQLVITEIMYNTPGIDHTEFIEIYNNGATEVNMEGYIMSGVEFTFPNTILAVGSFIIISKDGDAFERAYGIPALTWSGGATSNSGESIKIYDSENNLVDEVDYDDNNDWPKIADGLGCSIQICDVNADNIGLDNWGASIDATAHVRNGIPIFASPGFLGECTDKTIISFRYGSSVYNEVSGDTIDISYIISNAQNDTFTLNFNQDLSIPGSYLSTDDYSFIAVGPLTKEGATDGYSSRRIVLNDDDNEEYLEVLALNLTSSDDVIILNNRTNIYVIDNDIELNDPALIITGIADAITDVAGAQVIELTALKDITDLSNYGLGNANNGEGTDNTEFILPAISVQQCEKIYIVENSGMAEAFFGIESDIETSELFFSGDDAIELFENGEVVDVFGDINVDGSGEPWDYTNGWAIRNEGTGPDGSVFNVDNWTYGFEALDEVATNVEASNPFQTESYPCMTVSVYDEHLEKTIKFYPNPTNGNITIESDLDITHIKIANILGQEVLEKQITSNASSINLQALPKGSYIISFFTQDKFWSSKIIKK